MRHSNIPPPFPCCKKSSAVLASERVQALVVRVRQVGQMVAARPERARGEVDDLHLVNAQYRFLFQAGLERKADFFQLLILSIKRHIFFRCSILAAGACSLSGLMK